MASTFTPILRAELIGPGDQAGSWGTTTNNTLQYIFEASIAGIVSFPVIPVGGNYVLTYVNGASTTPTFDESIYAILKLLPGTTSTAYNIFIPPVSKTYIVSNTTLYAATFYNSTALGNTLPAGTGVTVAPNSKAVIFSDGDDCFYLDTVPGNFKVTGNATVTGTLGVSGILTAAGANFSSPLPIASGGTSSSTSTGTGSVVLQNSPTFTGVPAAPTAVPGTNTSQLANTAFVRTAINNLGNMSLQNSNAVNITGGTITGNYSLNAANGGVTSVNGRVGAVSLCNIISQGEFPANVVNTFTVDNTKSTVFFAYFGNGANGNSFLFSNIQWGMGGLSNSRVWYGSGVDFQVAQSGSMMGTFGAGSGTQLQVLVNANFINGYGSPGTVRIMVLQF